MLIETILFDIDGVLLSEERYFDASALTVWELLYSPAYVSLEGQLFKNQLTNQEIQDIRSIVFQKDDVLNFMKSLGINANWDMVYLTFSYQLILMLEAIQETEPELVEEGFRSPLTRYWLQKVGQAVNRLSSPHFKPLFDLFTLDLKSWPEEPDLFKRLDLLAEVRLGKKTNLFSSREPLWSLCQAAFQEFYLGSKLYKEVAGIDAIDPLKPGFLEDEIPLLTPETLQSLFKSIKKQGFSIGIGTGRPTIETEIPLRHLGLWELFESERIVTASDIENVKKEFPDWGPLSKPHPLTYLIGFFKREPNLETIYNLPRPIERAETLLIVGDSLADLLAARAIGAPFAAVLTGLSGQAARSTFETHNADYILNDLSELPTILPKKM